MQKGRVFRKRYLLIVLILILGYLIKAVNFSPYEQSVIKVENVGEFRLYVTEGSAGATTGYSYKYYLYPSNKSEKDFLKNMKEYQPILFTSDQNVGVQIKNNSLMLYIKGDVYSFNNVGYPVKISINATNQ